MKKLLLLLLKLTVSGLLLSLLFKKVGFKNIMNNFQSMNPLFFILSACLYLLLLYVASRRWGLLLEGKYPAAKLFSLYVIGSFFNHILPGMIGGDTVKAYYLYKDTRRGGSSVGSVFMDRYIGSAALIFVGLVSSIAAYGDLKAARMQYAVLALFAAFVVGSLAVFKIRIGRRFSAVSDFYDYFHAVGKKKRAVATAFFLSILIQVISISMVYIIARGLGQTLPFAALFVFVPVITVVTMIPVSISGLGLREGAFVVLFGLAGVPPQISTSISFLLFLSMATASLTGLVEYIRFRNKSQNTGIGAA